MSTITKEDVKRIARLSKLELTDEELERFALLFSKTLPVIDTLKELRTAEVPETYQVNGLQNVFQEEGEPRATLSQEEALSNASKKERGLFVTEGVFDRE
jgi:aspartyl-tRNA(Asn)/glutamyl-tRNA(Gln) amidotransferase subunit C